MLSSNCYSRYRRVKKNDLTDPSRVRRDGGGRKTIEYTIANIDEEFLSVVAEHVAGDPMNEKPISAAASFQKQFCHIYDVRCSMVAAVLHGTLKVRSWVP